MKIGLGGRPNRLISLRATRHEGGQQAVGGVEAAGLARRACRKPAAKPAAAWRRFST